MKKSVNVLILSISSFLLVFLLTELNGANPELNRLSLSEATGGAYLTYAGKFGGEISSSDLKNPCKIGIEGCAKGSKIYQFTLYVVQNQKSTVYKGTSHELSPEAIKHLKNLSAGDEFRFENIKATLPTGSKVDVFARKFSVV